MMTREQAKVGMKIYFGRANGEKTLGEIVKVNSKNLKVRQLEQRGDHHRVLHVGRVGVVEGGPLVREEEDVLHRGVPARELALTAQFLMRP